MNALSVIALCCVALAYGGAARQTELRGEMPTKVNPEQVQAPKVLPPTMLGFCVLH